MQKTTSLSLRLTMLKSLQKRIPILPSFKRSYLIGRRSRSKNLKKNLLQEMFTKQVGYNKATLPPHWSTFKTVTHSRKDHPATYRWWITRTCIGSIQWEYICLSRQSSCYLHYCGSYLLYCLEAFNWEDKLSYCYFWDQLRSQKYRLTNEMTAPTPFCVPQSHQQEKIWQQEWNQHQLLYVYPQQQQKCQWLLLLQWVATTCYAI